MIFDLKRSLALLIIGLFYLSFAGCSTTGVLESRAAPAVDAPKILKEQVDLGPSLTAHVKKIRFFEGERSKLAFITERKYETRFSHAMARTLYTEINLDHPRPETNVYFPITLYFRQNGKTVRIEEVESRIGPDWTASGHLLGTGDFYPGRWRVGKYEVDVYIAAKKTATGYFEIY
jgi:hypothetical protein